MAKPIRKTKVRRGAPVLHEILQADQRGFRVLSDLLRMRCGIFLPPSPKNEALMAYRLAPLFKRRAIASYADYVVLLRRDAAALQEFVEALATNTTEFFREPKHFEVLSQLLPDLLERKRLTGSREIRVWCAASSSGQEAYSIVMTLLENIPNLFTWDLKVLATDIDHHALRKASAGIFSKADIRSIPDAILKNHFTVVGEGESKAYQIRPTVQKFVTFADFNLVTEKYPFQFPFDLVFCRNVLIYFDPATGKAVVDRLFSSLAEDGFLFVGHSESGIVRMPGLRQVYNAVYQKKHR